MLVRLSWFPVLFPQCAEMKTNQSALKKGNIPIYHFFCFPSNFPLILSLHSLENDLGVQHYISENTTMMFFGFRKNDIFIMKMASLKSLSLR